MILEPRLTRPRFLRRAQVALPGNRLCLGIVTHHSSSNIGAAKTGNSYVNVPVPGQRSTLEDRMAGGNCRRGDDPFLRSGFLAGKKIEADKKAIRPRLIALTFLLRKTLHAEAGKDAIVCRSERIRQI